MFIVPDRSLAVIATLLFALSFALWGRMAADPRDSATGRTIAATTPVPTPLRAQASPPDHPPSRTRLPGGEMADTRSGPGHVARR